MREWNTQNHFKEFFIKSVGISEESMGVQKCLSNRSWQLYCIVFQVYCSPQLHVQETFCLKKPSLTCDL